MIQTFADAIYIGIAIGIVALLGHIRRFEWFLPLGVLAVVGLGFQRWILDKQWVLSSFMQDVPWTSAFWVGLWAASARSGWLKVSGWIPAVLGGLLVGDLAVAVGLSESDPHRRARLVLAASGASLIGRWGGAGPLVLGWGSPSVAALGILLVLACWTPGAMRVSVQRPNVKQALFGLSAAVCGAVLVWLLAAANVLELVALPMESLPAKQPGWAQAFVAVPAVVLGALFDEGMAAICLSGVLERAFSVKGTWAREAMLAGVVIGGGLPLLLISKSSLKTGIPLWLLQLALLGAWIYWR